MPWCGHYEMKEDWDIVIERQVEGMIWVVLFLEYK